MNAKKYGIIVMSTLTILQFVSTFLAVRYDTFQRMAAYNPNIRPAIFSFSIWFVILILSAIYAISCILKMQLAETKLVCYLAITFLGYSTWLAVARLNAVIPSLIVLCVMCYTLFRASMIVSKLEKNQIAKSLIFIYFGWVSQATFLNLASVFTYYQFESVYSGVIILLMSICFSVFVGFKATNYSYRYGFVVLWALSAIFLNLVATEQNLLLLWVTVFAALFGSYVFMKNKVV